MPRHPSQYAAYSYAPLTEDVEELLARFQETDSVRYTTFSAIWRDMKFSNIFFGILNPNESKKFSRLSLATAVKYFLPPYSYHIRAGGLYLMFGFFHTQLAVPPLRIRLAVKDWDLVQAFLQESLNAQHFDVIYIFQQLVSVKAFHFTAMPHFLNFQKSQKTKPESQVTEFLGRSTKIQELMSTNFLDEISNINRLYEKQKKGSMEVATAANVALTDIALHVKQCMNGFISWQEKTFNRQAEKSKEAGCNEEVEEAVQAREESSRRAMLLSSIKQKGYSNFQGMAKFKEHKDVAGVADSCGSGAEQVQESTVPQRKRRRPISLRARTYKCLGEIKEDKMDPWLVVAPDELDKRVSQSTS